MILPTCSPASHTFPPVSGLKGTTWFAVYCLNSGLPISEDNGTKSFPKAGSHASVDSGVALTAAFLQYLE